VAELTTYREWLVKASKTADPASLAEYIHLGGTNEGWNSEFKRSETKVDYALREAVASLANARGGEVFVGVANDGSVVGTEVTEQAMNEVLRQKDLPRNGWYVADLVQVVRKVVPVPFPAGARWAYVLEVRDRERPALTLDRDGRRHLPVRSGSDTIDSDALSAMEWMRETSRGVILTQAYSELSNYMGQISAYRGIPEGLPARLPYLSRVLETSDLRAMLTEEDIANLNGRGVQGGRSSGASDLYYKVLERAEVALQGKPPYTRNIRLVDLLGSEFANLDWDIKRALKDLGTYIRSQGYNVDLPSI
jgi:Putative DNA-binding domain